MQNFSGAAVLGRVRVQAARSSFREKMLYSKYKINKIELGNCKKKIFI
jgi:hypothetical protein